MNPMGKVEFDLDRASEAQVYEHLVACDQMFIPALSSRVNLSDYAAKIVDRAKRFEAWSGSILIGMVAVYCNDPEKRSAFVTSVSVLSSSMGKGIGSALLARAIESIRQEGFSRVELEVAQGNGSAISLYLRHGFSRNSEDGSALLMHLDLR